MSSATQQSLMDVTRALSSSAASAGFDFGPDTALVAVQHLLYQTVDLFRSTSHIGLRPENIFVLGKVYSNSTPIINVLRNIGVTVIDSTFPAPGDFDGAFERDVERLWQLVGENMTRRGFRRIIVLDDGGKCVTKIPPELLSNYPVTGVEQTSMGMFLFEQQPPPFALFTWARSAVKLQVGGHIFSHRLIDRVENEFLRGGKLKNADVGIIGLGSIGRSLADIVARQGNRVMFYDAASNLEIPLYLRGRVTRLDSLEELMWRCEYVFGSSGRNPFERRWPMAHRADIKLFSGSGGDQEFGPIIRFLRQRPGFKVARDSWDITSEAGPSGAIRIAFSGFPYNFVSRAETAVPTLIVQLETGGLLAGLIQARNHLELLENGLAPDARIRRVSPDAQGFVYDSWRWAMKNRGIDIRSVYGYDPALLAAIENNNWIAENTEPRSASMSESDYVVEEMMRSMLDGHSEPAQ